MSTERSYVGRGTNANTPPQMAQNEAQTPLAPDDRQYKSFGFSRQYISENKAIYEGKEAILSIIYDFLGRSINPVHAVNTLLVGYLTGNNQGHTIDADKVECLLEMTTFFYDLRVQINELHFCEGEVRKDEAAEKEVSNE